MEPITEDWKGGQFCKNIEPSKKKKLAKVLSELVLTADDIERIIAVFTQQMDMANSAKPDIRSKSDHLMENTHIRQLMDGTENGEYLGLDLGGTNYRVVLAKFKNGVADITIQNYVIPEHVLSGPSSGAFDFIADGIRQFFEKYNMKGRTKKIPLGFTFSFPSRQKTLKSQTLVTWTKSFKCPDGPGLDPVQLLEEALQRNAPDVPVEVVVVMSDTTSTLMAGNYVDKKARIGLILGTGCNAAFVENLDNIERWSGDRKDPQHVIVNVEWGATGDKGCLDFCRTKYEKQLDQLSNHPKSFTFEKSVGGLYLGELVRLMLVELAKEGLVFGGYLPPSLQPPWSLTATQITQIESDKGDDSSNTVSALKELGVSDPDADDVAVVREVAEMVCRRGAYVVSCGLAALVKRMGLAAVTVAIDGSVYERHPKFHGYMMEILGDSRFDSNTQIELILVKDGSGQGGAFAAASALRQLAAGIRCQ
ncbi:hexokinase-4-like [Littorina saxatilis]|uniref:Phosphotransferase n=1 Tax=Littorina saxatilis TaxID=31220 RepID=A0AAN9BN53_9CAEN